MDEELNELERLIQAVRRDREEALRTYGRRTVMLALRLGAMLRAKRRLLGNLERTLDAEARSSIDPTEPGCLSAAV